MDCSPWGNVDRHADDGDLSCHSENDIRLLEYVASSEAKVRSGCTPNALRQRHDVRPSIVNTVLDDLG